MKKYLRIYQNHLMDNKIYNKKPTMLASEDKLI